MDGHFAQYMTNFDRDQNQYGPTLGYHNAIGSLPQQYQKMNFLPNPRAIGKMGPQVNPMLNMVPPQPMGSTFNTVQLVCFSNPLGMRRKQKEPDTFDGKNTDWVDHIIQFD